MKKHDLTKYNGFKAKVGYFPYKKHDILPMKYWFKGWMDKESNQGGIWSGILPVPLKSDDFQNLSVLATDY